MVFLSPADEGVDFMLSNNIEATYPECDNSGTQCIVDNCINIELQNDIEIEGDEVFEITIIDVSLGSIGLPSTLIFIQDMIGGQI